MRIAILSTILALAAPAVMAAPMSGAMAAKQLYPDNGAEVQVLQVKGLTRKQRRILEQVGAAQKYYGAIAFSPGDGLVNTATVAAANFHAIEAAERTALRVCNARRSAKAPCVIAARILPKGYRAGRRLGLSSEATKAFDTIYRKQRDPKAMAISRSSGLYGIAQGPGAGRRAIAACRGKAEKGQKAGDCAIVIAN